MIDLTLSEIADLTGGELHHVTDPQARVTGGVEFDSRKLGDGGLFVALPGERVDGHDFAAQAVADGAGGQGADHDAVHGVGAHCERVKKTVCGLFVHVFKDLFAQTVSFCGNGNKLFVVIFYSQFFGYLFADRSSAAALKQSRGIAQQPFRGIVPEHLDAVEAVEGNGLGKYVDSTVEDNKTYRYRITGIWADGTRVTSVETNDALYYVPPELVKDGGFESGKFAADRNDGWQNMGYLTGFEEANYITDENPKTGKYSLKIDTVNNNHNGYATVWQTFPGTEAGKVYQVKWSRYIVQGGYDIKNDYNEPATCVLTKKNGGTITAIFFSGGNADQNNKWLDHTFEKGVGPETDIGVKFMSGTANHKIIFYVDDISCKEVK